MTMRTTQTLELVNSDAISYNPNLTLLRNAPWLPALQAGQIARKVLSVEEPLPIRICDNINPWLVGWVVARDNPYAVATESDGTFAMRDLPAGAALEFRLWHERIGYLKHVTFDGGETNEKGAFKIAINAGQTNLGDIVVPAKLIK